MTHLPLRKKMQLVALLILQQELMESILFMLIFVAIALILKRPKRRRIRYAHESTTRLNIRALNLHKIAFESDKQCIDNIRMDRRAFVKLCALLKSHGQLKETKNISIEELVISFLHIISHHVKNRVMKRQVARSGETISRQFHAVLKSILRLHTLLLKKPEPIDENCTDRRWDCFKGCLGALDGTFIRVNVKATDRPRYRTRKSEIATNVLGVCTPDLQFIYVLPGWEGSAHDGRVLRDAISRRNGLKVPEGCYYLCDAGYTNCEGFLTPYRGQRYHLSEWRHDRHPTTPEEYFNMKHSQARNCIERCFGILKARWGILKEKSYYPIKTQCRIISACCLLHNFIRSEMPIDPIENSYEESDITDLDEEEDLIRFCEPSSAWTEFRDNKAEEMFTRWLAEKNG